MIPPIKSAIKKIYDTVGRGKIGPSDCGEIRSINSMIPSSKVKGNRILPAAMENTRTGGGYNGRDLWLGLIRDYQLSALI